MDQTTPTPETGSMKHVLAKYDFVLPKIGQIVQGKILKLASFGAFVELDQDIQGLAHIGELTDKKVQDASEVLKEGETCEFKIISIEPAEHRLGLSIKALKNAEPAATAPEQPKEETVEAKTEAAQEETKEKTEETKV